MGRGTGYRIRFAGVVLLIALVVGAVWFWKRAGDGRPATRIRNVVLISIDTCRSDHLTCYGWARPTTPNIDEVARQGALFENVIAPVPLTLPSHSSMLTGTNPPYHDVHDNLDYQFSQANVTLAELLRKNGFTTGAIVSAAVLDSQFGLDQGFDAYLDPESEGEIDDHGAERPGRETTELALQWLQQNQGDKFFLFLHYFDAHGPYAPPEPFASQYADDPYSGEIAHVDACIGQVIGKLKELGLYDSTLLIITGDHGEMLGEHGEGHHGFFIYQSELRVPLVIRLPGQKANGRFSDLVGLVDIVPTVCSLLEVERPPVLHGEDLSAALMGKNLAFSDRGIYCESFLATRYDANSLLGLVTDRWKYIQTTRPELYDVVTDPGETTNLVDRELEVEQSLSQQLQQMLQEQCRQLADSSIKLDEATKRRLESLGYVGGRDDTASVPAVYTQDPNKDDPKDLLAYYNAHSKLTQLMHAGDIAAARAMCEQMIAERPQSWTAYYHLAEMAIREGDNPAARSALLEVLARRPDHAGVHNQLGVVLQSLGETTEAIAHFRQAVALRPLFPGSHYNLGNALRAAGDWEGAISAYRQALAVDPEFVEAHLNLAVALQTQNKLPEAIEHLRQAIQFAPDSSEAHYNLGTLLLRLGQVDEALAEMRQAADLAPEWPLPLGGVARILSTSSVEQIRNPHEATVIGERAAELSGRRDPLILDILAAAYAADGRFEAAVATQQEAIALATAAGDAPSVAKLRQRLQLYQQAQPHGPP